MRTEKSKIARCCGAKQIWKSKCTKHTMFGPLLDVEICNKCMRLCCEANFEDKIRETLAPEHLWKLSVAKVHAIVAGVKRMWK